MRRILASVVAVLLISRVFAYNYSEHRDIGDVAFARLVAELSKQGNAALLMQFLNVKQNEDSLFYFTDLSVKGGRQITYGVLNGLSGDHSPNPLELEKQLRLKNSVMQQILLLHQQYLDMGYTSAPEIGRAHV